MNSNLFHTIRHTIIVDEEILRRLVALIERKFSKVKLEIECSDHSEKTASDIDELIAYDNAHYHRIKILTIKGSSYEKSEYCTVRIKASPFRSNAFVSVEAEESLAESIKAELLNIIKIARVPGVREWLYFTTPSSVYLFLAIPLLLINLLSHNNRKNVPGIDAFAFTGFIITSLAIFFALEFLYSILYPRIFFALGLQKKALDTVYTWQNIIWTVIILGSVIGLGVNYISSRLGL